MQQATVAMLEEVVDVVGSWQHDGLPVHVHPGDLGWLWRFGAQQVVDGLWLWRSDGRLDGRLDGLSDGRLDGRSDGRLVAVGMVDGAEGLIRMAISPEVGDDEFFARRFVDDLSDSDRGVLPRGRGVAEVRYGPAVRGLLSRRGWIADESWTPLSRDLAAPVQDCGVRIETVDAQHVRDEVVRDRVAVQRAAFPNSTFTVKRWHALAASPAYRSGRCLVAYDTDDQAVAATTVWSAGSGRPGLIEPLGTHRAFRGRGYGCAIAVAAAAELQKMGASSVVVCTPTSNVGGIAAYLSAGFTKLADVTDFRRPDSA